MHLIFKSIRIVRFRSFIEEAVLDFEDAGPGLYFLKGKNNAALGSNGAGKSSVIDALMWCLYGRTVKGLRNPDIIPWSGKGISAVRVQVLVDGNLHSIVRTASPNKLTLDGNECGQGYIDKLIAIPFEILPYTIIIGQSQPLFYDLTASEKLKLFSEVLNLDRWETRSIHAGKIVIALEREIASASAELELHKLMLIQTAVDFNKAKEQSALWEAGRAEELEEAEAMVHALEGAVKAVMPDRDTADLQLDRALTELKAIVLEPVRKEERKLSFLVTSLLNDEKQAETKIKQLENSLLSINAKKCPTCNQPLTSHKQLKKDVEQQIKNIDLASIQDARAEACTWYAECEKELDIQEAAKKEFENAAETARHTLDRLQPKIAGWEAQLQAVKKSLEQHTEVANPYTEQLQALRRRRDQCKVSIEQTEEKIKTKTEYCERVRFWIKGFKDIKLLTIEEILQELEISTNGLLEQFGLVGWRIKYDIERETKSGTIARGLNITVLSPFNKQPVKWEVWSGGEGQRLRIIGTAALSSVLLNHVGVTTNVEFYDEPTESLSREGVQDLVELLAQRAKDTKKAIWFVDHHVIESSHFTQTVLVTKNKSGSMLAIV